MCITPRPICHDCWIASPLGKRSSWASMASPLPSWCRLSPFRGVQDADLVGEYGLFGRFNNFEDYFRKFQRNNFNVGLQVKIPLVSSQRSANVALAKSELSASEMELRNKRQNVELEVSRQYQRLRELDAAREVARLELKLAQENLQVIQANFQEGRANLRDVERARLDENEKWVAFLDSDYDRQKAQLDLLNITGDLGKIFK